MPNAVEVVKENAQVQVVSESAAIIQVIERAAMNPNVDIDKMERLLQMQERIMERNAKAAYDAAFAVMQPELPIIEEHGGIKDRGGNVQSTYALWEDINESIKPVLSRHGFGISFRTGARDGKVVVTGILSHRDGHREETTMELPVDASGNKNAVQAVGSSTSYGKRYTAQALLNLTSRGEDDDGKAGGGKVHETASQLKKDGAWEKITSDLANVMIDVKTMGDFMSVKQEFTDRAAAMKFPPAWKNALNNELANYEVRLESSICRENLEFEMSGLKDLPSLSKFWKDAETVKLIRGMHADDRKAIETLKDNLKAIFETPEHVRTHPINGG